MKQFTKNKLSVLVGLAIAGNFSYAEPPAPPPVQMQGGTAAQQETSAGRITPSSVVVTPLKTFDTRKAKAQVEQDYAQMVGIPYGSFLLFPELALTQTHDSNIYALRKNDVSDSITTLTPSLVAKSNWSQHRLNFNAGGDFDRYRDHNSENVDDYWVGFDGQYDLSGNSNIFGGVQNSRSHEDRGSPDAVFGLEPTVYTSTEAYLGAEVKTGPVSVRFGGIHEDLDYRTPTGMTAPNSTNDDRDRTLTSVGGRVGYDVTPTVMPFVQAATDTRSYNRSIDDYGFQRSSDGYRAAVGAVFRPNVTLQGEAFVGRMHQNYDDARFNDLDRAYFGANLSWKPVPGTRLTAFVDRSLGETTIPGSAGYVDSTVGMHVERPISPDLIANAGIAYSISEYQGIDRTDRVTDAGAGVKYYISPTVYLGADYRMLNRDSSSLEGNYFRDIVMFSVGFTPARQRIKTENGSVDGIQAGDVAELHGQVMPKLAYFDYTGGVGRGMSHYLERYDYRQNNFGDSTSDNLIADIDLNLLYADAKHDLLQLEREGFGANNQHTRLRGNSDFVKFNAYHSAYTSATGGIDYLYNPNVVAGGTDANYDLAGNTGESQHVAYFNADSPDTSYKVTRTSYGASMQAKPAAFNGLGSVELSYKGYTRDGNQVANYILSQHDFAAPDAAATALREKTQWRGYSRVIDEQNRNLAFNLTLNPQDSWLFNYEFSIDKFQNNAPSVTMNDVSQWSGIAFSGGGLHFQNTVDPNRPLNFVADSTQFTNSLRMTKQFSEWAVLGAGVSMSRLQQDTFGPEYDLGYTEGRNDTDSAYLTGKFNVSQSVGLEAFMRYNKRENNSSFPVAGFYEVLSNKDDERLVAPRINKVTSKTYGLEAKLYPRFLKTSWSAGWTHEDKDRDLTYGEGPALAAPMTLYGVSSSSDEVFIKLVSRPAKGWMVRVTPSYLWADQTGLVTEPEEMLKLKAVVSYTRPEWNELLISGYYNYTDKKNGLLSYSGYTVTGAAGGAGSLQTGYFNLPQAQKMDSTLQSAGLNLSLVPVEDVKASLGYAWNQTDFSSYYFSTNRLRYHYLYVPDSAIPTSTDFLVLGQPNYKVNTHTLSAGLEKQWSRYLFSGSYSLTWSEGNNASGLPEPLPEADAKVDNYLHSLSLGVEYAWKKNMSLRGTYIYDYYKDHVYRDLSGGYNTLILGLNYRL